MAGKCRCGEFPATHQGAAGPVCCRCFQEEFDHCSNISFDPADRLNPNIVAVCDAAKGKPSEAVRHLFLKTPKKNPPPETPETPG